MRLVLNDHEPLIEIANKKLQFVMYGREKHHIFDSVKLRVAYCCKNKDENNYDKFAVALIFNLKCFEKVIIERSLSVKHFSWNSFHRWVKSFWNSSLWPMQNLSSISNKQSRNSSSLRHQRLVQSFHLALLHFNVKPSLPRRWIIAGEIPTSSSTLRKRERERDERSPNHTHWRMCYSQLVFLRNQDVKISLNFSQIGEMKSKQFYNLPLHTNLTLHVSCNKPNFLLALHVPQQYIKFAIRLTTSGRSNWDLRTN